MKYRILTPLIAALTFVGTHSFAQVSGTRLNPMGPGNHSRFQPVDKGVAGVLLDSKQVQTIRSIMKSNPFAHRKHGKNARTSYPSVLVLFDSNGPYGYIGSGYARQLGALLTHFPVTINILPVEQYQSGMINANAATFYLGTTFENTLPTAFTVDAMTATQPLCWCGYNLWKIAWTPDYSAFNQGFLSQYGFAFNYMDPTVYPTVRYNGFALAGDRYSTGQANVTIYNSKIAKVVARSSNASGQTMPYMIHSGNLWYIGENPLQNSSTNLTADRSAAFHDAMHDILNDGVTVDNSTHKAVLRIEDVHAHVDPDALKDIADYLAAQNVPYVVCVIPHYRDPFGVYNGGTPEDITINDNPALVSALQYMQSKGGQIIMHGDTHQYDDVANSVSGVSGDDYEFYRFMPDPNNPASDLLTGPTFEDSPAWVHGRIAEGLSILSTAGFSPVGWNTPHYFASLVDYQEFQNDFQFSMCRGKTFTADGLGNSYVLDQMINWPIQDDLGMVRMPENLGYVSTSKYGVTGQRPDNLLAVSKKMKVIRDGWVGMYFHPFLNLKLLKQLVSGVKAQGYTFVNPSASLLGQ